jgi:hypothetical protein
MGNALAPEQLLFRLFHSQEDLPALPVSAGNGGARPSLQNGSLGRTVRRPIGPQKKIDQGRAPAEAVMTERKDLGVGVLLCLSVEVECTTVEPPRPHFQIVRERKPEAVEAAELVLELLGGSQVDDVCDAHFV